MTAWQKEEIEVESREKVSAQMPVIVSASRSTDMPAFYSDWFVERFNGGNGYFWSYLKYLLWHSDCSPFKRNVEV